MTSRTEEEELAAIKEWWQRNGKPLLAGGALALAGVLGWQLWQDRQINQSQAASALYQQLVDISLNGAGEPDAAELFTKAEATLTAARRHLGDELYEQFRVTLDDMKPEYVG